MYDRWFVSTMLIFASCSAFGASPHVALPGDRGSISAVVLIADDAQCRNWRRECVRRWGTASWKLKRCIRNHGCPDWQ